MGLFVYCVNLANDDQREGSRYRSSSNGVADVSPGQRKRGNGLHYYLGCTTLLCLARCVSFALALFNDGDMQVAEASSGVASSDSDTYCSLFQDVSFQWEVHGAETLIIRGSYAVSIIQILLSTMSTALFFSSYTYFAHSLTRVLGAVITSHSLHHRILFGSSDSSGFSFVGQWLFGLGRGSLGAAGGAISTSSGISRTDENSSATANNDGWLGSSLLALNSMVWMSVVLVWTSLSIRSRYYAIFADLVAQIMIAVAVIVMAFIFTTHFTRALWFLYELRQVGGKAVHLSNLLKLRHVLGVICVCTLCFVVRAMLIVTRHHLSAAAEDGYFLVLEAFPTLYMLYSLQQQQQQLQQAGSGSPEQLLGRFEEEASYYGNNYNNSEDEDGWEGVGVFAGQDNDRTGLLAGYSNSNSRARAAKAKTQQAQALRNPRENILALSHDEYDDDDDHDDDDDDDDDGDGMQSLGVHSYDSFDGGLSVGGESLFSLDIGSIIGSGSGSGNNSRSSSRNSDVGAMATVQQRNVDSLHEYL
jgi:hypothetical protein